jgi:hypothetical protein
MKPHYDLRAKLLSEKMTIEVKTEERKREITKLEETVKEYEHQMENVVQVSIKNHTEKANIIEEQIKKITSGGKYLAIYGLICEGSIKIASLREAVERKKVESEVSENL